MEGFHVALDPNFLSRRRSIGTPPCAPGEPHRELRIEQAERQLIAQGIELPEGEIATS